MPPLPTAPSAPRPGFWRRRVLEPVLRQLRAGITPEKVALTIALGCVVGVFPILGSSTILCTAVAAVGRLNQPIMQIVNYVVYPLQLLTVIPFYYGGQRLFGQTPQSLSIPMLLTRFRADLGQFFRDFGVIALEGIALWFLISPIVVGLLYVTLRPALRAAARRLESPLS